MACHARGTPGHPGAAANLDVVALLLDVPAVDVNAVDAAGRTALMAAAQEGHRAVVTALLAARANVFIADRLGMPRPLLVPAPIQPFTPSHSPP